MEFDIWWRKCWRVFFVCEIISGRWICDTFALCKIKMIYFGGMHDVGLSFLGVQFSVKLALAVIIKLKWRLLKSWVLRNPVSPPKAVRPIARVAI